MELEIKREMRKVARKVDEMKQACRKFFFFLVCVLASWSSCPDIPV